MMKRGTHEDGHVFHFEALEYNVQFIACFDCLVWIDWSDRFEPTIWMIVLELWKVEELGRSELVVNERIGKLREIDDLPFLSQLLETLRSRWLFL